MKLTGEGLSPELEAAARFFALKLMDGRLVRHLNIEIELDANFMFAGLCVSDDDRPRPRYFTIKINPYASYHLVECLAHEMVHVRQMATGQLIDLGDNWIIWEGKKYKCLSCDNPDSVNEPFEEEAYRLADDLYEDWLSQEVFE